MIAAVEWKNGCVRLLDQRRLPGEVAYRDCRDHHAVAEGIRELWVRGAPAIGIAAAMGVALAARNARATTSGQVVKAVAEARRELAATRPTAVNLFWALNRMQASAESHRDLPADRLVQRLEEEAQNILKEDIAMNREIGRHGAPLLDGVGTVLTHCNAGALATGGYGTALGVIRAARESGAQLRVYVDETRPVLQGARLTAWELEQDGFDVTLITDNMAGYFMARGAIHACVVGADRIAANGDTANKIGTYSVAVLARAHGIPFYVAAPSSTIDFSIPDGRAIPIEERSPDEVVALGGVRIAPSGVRVANPAFDVTPAELITAIVTDRGAFRPPDLKLLEDPKADLERYRVRRKP